VDAAPAAGAAHGPAGPGRTRQDHHAQRLGHRGEGVAAGSSCVRQGAARARGAAQRRTTLAACSVRGCVCAGTGSDPLPTHPLARPHTHTHTYTHTHTMYRCASMARTRPRTSSPALACWARWRSPRRCPACAWTGAAALLMWPTGVRTAWRGQSSVCVPGPCRCLCSALNMCHGTPPAYVPVLACVWLCVFWPPAAGWRSARRSAPFTTRCSPSSWCLRQRARRLWPR
jgi:hypothetical protein